MKGSALIVFLFTGFFSLAQCPTEATLENTGTKTIPTDGSCDSPADDNLVCNVNGAFLDLDGTLTVLSCATLNLTSTATIFSFGNIVVEDGATLTSNRTLRIRSGSTATINGNLNITNGNLRVVSGSTLTVGSSGTVDVQNNLVVGSGGGNAGTVNLNGQLTTGGNATVNGGGSLSGNGHLTHTGTFTSTGTLGGVFATGCSGSNSSCGDPTLPVELISFEGKNNRDTGNKLSWSTASELNNEGFHIEKSADGVSFRSIAFIDGHGTVNETKTYSFTDPSSTGDAYYRLKQVDFDGQFEYSPVIFVRSGFGTGVAVSVFPNPVSDRIRIVSNAESVFQVQLVDMSGRSVVHLFGKTIAEAEQGINNVLQNMKRGTYVIRLSNSVEQKAIPFVKI